MKEYEEELGKKGLDEPKKKKSVVDSLMACLGKKDHMNILQMDSSDSAMEIDEIILQALLKG